MERVKYFPIPFFAVVMGISGLSIAYQKASSIFGLPLIVHDLLLLISIFAFLLISSLYLTKAIYFFDEVKSDFSHPIKINFFSAFSISLILISISLYQYSPNIATVLWYIGTLVHLFMTFYVVSFWIRHNFEITHSNPAWFIPIVGNILIPILGVEIVSREISIYFFSVGAFFWIILGTIIFYRVIFHHQLAQKFIPTLFIFIAPPAVGFISYIKLTNSFDFFAQMLLSIALFFAILLFFMGKSFLKLKFFISWWAFTFPLDAIAIAFLLAFDITKVQIYAIFGTIFLAIATIIILYVSYMTIINIKHKEICVSE